MSKAKDLIKQLGSKQAATDFLRGKEKNDCVVRAVQHSFGVDYVDAHHFCETKLNRVSGKGTYTNQYLPKVKQAFGCKITKMGKNGRLTRDQKHAIITWDDNKQKQITKRKIIKVRYKVKDFLKIFNNGKFIVIVKGHAFAVVEGVIFGNWDDANKLNREIWSAYKIK
jgi:hypothetical protein